MGSLHRWAPLCAVVLVAAIAAPSSALVDRWASWTAPTGSSNDYTATMQQLAPGFPAATMRSDSRSSVQLASGSSVFLRASTPPGAKYGESRNQPYMVLRPRADSASAPSTTTYTFDQPTPEIGWAFVLGDVDADSVRISAVDGAGGPVPAAAIDDWFQGTFNHAGGSDLPTWSAATSTLTGNAAALDTDGASGWFEPDVALSSLTLTFTRRAGFPVYQTWFVSRARPVAGTVEDVSTDGSCPVAQSMLTLVSPHGVEVATTQPEADGSYSFGDVATQSGWTVRLRAPQECAIVGGAEQPASNVGNDGDQASLADFEVRAIVPYPISGTVRDDDGAPLAGVEVTLTPPGGGSPVTTTTDDEGRYLFDDNPIADRYTIAITVPSGYVAGPAGSTIEGVDVVAGPVTGQDFVVAALPSLSGTVTGGGGPLGGVPVTLTPLGGGSPVTTVTRGDGSYLLDGVAPGQYEISIEAPAGFGGTTTRTATVGAADVTGQDFALTRPGALGGAVTDAASGAPLEGIEVVVTGPGGDRTLVTDGEGGFYAGDLGPGTYEVAVQVPTGSEAVGVTSYTVVITEAGEIVGERDFVLEAAGATPTPTPTPTTPGGEPGGNDGSGDDSGDGPGDVDGAADGELPDTGGPGSQWVPLGVASVLAGLALLVVGRRRSGAH